MSEILCKEKISVIIENHPFHESLNKKIIKEIEEKDLIWQESSLNRDGGISNVRALTTRSVENSHNQGYRISSSSIELVYEWILNLLRSKTEGWKILVDNSWIARYREKEFAVSHNHYPCSYSFVYFVKCPKGSSPLIFPTSGKKIKAEEGKVVIFPGNLWHSVPQNKCEDRIVLAGNVLSLTEDYGKL